MQAHTALPRLFPTNGSSDASPRTVVPISPCGTLFGFSLLLHEPGLLENSYKFAVTARNFRNRFSPRNFVRAPLNERLPEICAAHSEANETRNASRIRQPFAHLFVVLATAQNDAADALTASLARRCHHPLAVLLPVESFDFPNIRLNVRVLELFNRVNH